MWNFIKNVIKNNPGKSITIMGIISAGNFVLNLLQALKDGVITDTEWHSLMSGANGIEALILGIIAIVLKLKA